MHRCMLPSGRTRLQRRLSARSLLKPRTGSPRSSPMTSASRSSRYAAAILCCNQCCQWGLCARFWACDSVALGQDSQLLCCTAWSTLTLLPIALLCSSRELRSYCSVCDAYAHESHIENLCSFAQERLSAIKEGGDDE